MRLLDEGLSDVALEGRFEPGASGLQLRFVSARVAELLGRPAADFRRDPGLWASLVHPGDREPLLAVTLRALRRPAPFVREYRARHARSGEYRWLEETLRPRYGPNGRLRGFSGSVRDVTARKAAEYDLGLTRAVMDQLADLVICVDERGGLLYVNQAAVRALGYAHDQLLRMHVSEISPDFLAERWAIHWADVRRAG